MARCEPPIHAASVSLVGASVVAGATRCSPREWSVLCVRSDGCSRRSTRAKPHAPPCAASEGEPREASAPPLVAITTRGGGGWVVAWWARARARWLACSEGEAEASEVRRAATTCGGGEAAGVGLQVCAVSSGHVRRELACGDG